ncbi:MAG: InlB B-repeat-containing protein [Bacteroidales bacterium]|nr:InlB B-repeat-containing protein [Bacteroidales bacterium]
MRTPKRTLMIIAIIMIGMLAISGCKDKTTYTVTFDPNGGTGVMVEQIFTEGESQALTLNTFTREDYAFINWSVMKDGNGTSYRDGETITVTFNMTLYAQWKCTNPTSGPEPVDSVTITFDANGGTGEMAPMSFASGETHHLTANAFSKENYWFTGWNTSTDGSGTAYADSAEVAVTESVTLFAQWSLGVTGNAGGHDYVDLGLPSGMKWATCNVGADSPVAYGDYFAWGETSPKETYSCANYIWCNNDEDVLTKYCDNPNFGNNGFTDNIMSLLPEDDAATVNWNAGWRTPTYNEMSELRNHCTVTRTTQKGVNGRLFTGPNGNSIFLPTAGNRYDNTFAGAGSYSSYHTSSIVPDFPSIIRILFFDSDRCILDFGARYCGQPVRAVWVE